MVESGLSHVLPYMLPYVSNSHICAPGFHFMFEHIGLVCACMSTPIFTLIVSLCLHPITLDPYAVYTLHITVAVLSVGCTQIFAANLRPRQCAEKLLYQRRIKIKVQSQGHDDCSVVLACSVSDFINLNTVRRVFVIFRRTFFSRQSALEIQRSGPVCSQSNRDSTSVYPYRAELAPTRPRPRGPRQSSRRNSFCFLLRNDPSSSPETFNC